MTIGVITNSEISKSESLLNSFIKNNDCNINVFVINNKENFKNADIYIFEQSSEEHSAFFGNLQNKNIIINSDDEKTTLSLMNVSAYVLSCGLSYKDTVTASSIEDNLFTFCLQRAVISISSQPIAPQEFRINTSEKLTDIYPILAVVTSLLLCEVSTAKLRKFMF